MTAIKIHSSKQIYSEDYRRGCYVTRWRKHFEVIPQIKLPYIDGYGIYGNDPFIRFNNLKELNVYLKGFLNK